MAEAVVPEPSREPASQAEEPLPRFARRPAVHGGRFMIGYAVIVVMVLAALLTIGFMSRADESSSTTAAGGLTTEEGGFQRARVIATEIARQYRGANGEQLVAVTAPDRGGLRPSPPVLRAPPRAQQAAHPGRRLRRPARRDGALQLLRPRGRAELLASRRADARAPDAAAPRSGRAVVLHLQAPARDRDRRFAPSACPRGEGQPPQTFAVYFQRRHMEGLLGSNLTRALPEKPPFADGDLSPGEADTINRLTETRLFTSSFEQLPTQGVMLSLSPPSA